jgi:chemotaxis protein methyltransferase CheR
MTAESNTATLIDDGRQAITDEDFHAFRDLIHRETGIALNDGKREMLCARLAKRLRHLGCQDYGEYYRYLVDGDPEGREKIEMINCVTTNKTDFFREPHHFDFLRNVVIPEVEARSRTGGARRLRIWSAACSTGEEPYSIAMTLRDRIPAQLDWDIRILASDIDSEVLAKAQRGSYEDSRISDVPASFRTRYLRRDPEDDRRSIVDSELQSLIGFRRINFMDEAWPIRTTFDVIFCRNVIIYFDRPTQQKLFERMALLLAPGGYLILGHSENLYGISDRFEALGNTVYRLERPPGSGMASKPLLVKSCTSAKHVRKPQNEEDATIIAGQIFASARPACVSTLLGSCVAACLYDRKAGVGGMNHFLLPDGFQNGDDSARFGVHAMELLINEIMKKGGDRRRLQAKVFGGAKVLDFKSASLNVGTRNAEFVRDFLAAESIPIVSKCLGGNSGLKVKFLTHTGQAFVKAFDGRSLQDVARREATHAAAMAQAISAESSDVTLF